MQNKLESAVSLAKNAFEPAKARPTSAKATALKITEERIELLRSWRHSGFNVDSSRRVDQGDRLALEQLLQYIERPPVSLERRVS